MNLSNFSQLRFNNKDITLAKLNGNVLYRKEDSGSEEPSENLYYAEYTVASSTNVLNKTVTSGSYTYCYGLPRIYYGTGTADWNFPTSDMVEITLKDGTITNDLATKCSGIAKVKVYYPKETYAVKFYGSSGCKPLIKSLNYIKTNNITNMTHMFSNCSSLTSLDLSNFNTSNVTSMDYMFNNCSKLKSLNASTWDTSNVTSMSNMFYGCYALKSLDLSNFNTSNVTNMNRLFYDCDSLTSLDVSNFDTSNVTTMHGMFNYCSSLTSLDLSSFDTSNVTSMDYMFDNCKVLAKIEGMDNWNTSNVTNMNYMFNKCSALTSLDLSNFDTSNVTSMDYMFDNCSKLKSLNASTWDTSNVTSMYSMFSSCYIIDWHYDGTNYTNWTLTESKTSSSMIFPWNLNFEIDYSGPYYVEYTVADIIVSLNERYSTLIMNGLPRLYINSAFTFPTSDMVEITLKDGTITNDLATKCSDIAKVKVYYPSSAKRLCFWGSSVVGHYINNIEYIKTDNFNNMSYMFCNCSSLTSLNVSTWNTSNVTNMSYMFNNCSSLTSLDLSNFDTSNVTNMDSMFSGCSSLTSLDLSNFNTSKVTEKMLMFSSVPVTIDWNYDGTNYTNFTLTETQTGFPGTFPWNQ